MSGCYHLIKNPTGQTYTTKYYRYCYYYHKHNSYHFIIIIINIVMLLLLLSSFSLTQKLHQICFLLLPTLNKGWNRLWGCPRRKGRAGQNGIRWSSLSVLGFLCHAYLHQYQSLTNRIQEPYWGRSSGGCGSTDRMQQGTLKNNWGPIFPSMARESEVNK